METGATDDRDEEWVDIHMTDRAEGEWDLDVVVLDGQVSAVELRVRQDLLTSFVECLVEDMPAEQARAVVERLAERHGVVESPDPPAQAA